MAARHPSGREGRGGRRPAGADGSQRAQPQNRAAIALQKASRIEKTSEGKRTYINSLTGRVKRVNRCSWETMFAELETFKSEHRHCNVTQTSGKLGIWVKNVRISQKKGELSEERKKILDNVGFAWQVRTSSWETMLAELEAFKREHGHCNVTRKSGKLGTWVTNARSRQKKGNLSEEQKDSLDNLGFTWYETTSPGRLLYGDFSVGYS